MNIMLNDRKDMLKVMADQKLGIMNENHLFEAMGLTKIGEEEIEQNFSSELEEFLKKQLFIEINEGDTKRGEE